MNTKLFQKTEKYPKVEETTLNGHVWKNLSETVAQCGLEITDETFLKPILLAK